MQIALDANKWHVFHRDVCLRANRNMLVLPIRATTILSSSILARGDPWENYTLFDVDVWSEHDVWKPHLFDMCRNFEWLVCGAHGRLPGQGSARHIHVATPLGNFRDPLPKSTVQLLYYTGFELCTLATVCSNGAELLDLQPGETFVCELDRGRYDGLTSAILDAYPPPRAAKQKLQDGVPSKSWRKYLRAVYSSDDAWRSPGTVQVVWNHTLHAIGGLAGRLFQPGRAEEQLRVTLRPNSRTWPPSLIFNPLYEAPKRARYDQVPNWNRPDHSWVEVLRVSPTRFGECDGLTRAGGTADGSKQPQRFATGCWFHSVPGSGVFVNIGKSLRLPMRHSDRPAGAPLALYRTFGRAAQGGAYRGYDMYDFDFTWCENALAMGYDSIQVGEAYMGDPTDPQRAIGEIAICSGACATTEVCSACPPVPLRTGVSASTSCGCQERSGVMECAGPRSPHSVWTKGTTAA